MKAALADKIRLQLKERLERLTLAAKESQKAATDPDSKAESKYDTRNIEASYLAAGQARQVEELGRAVQMFERLSLADYSTMNVVGPGALVELRAGAESDWFLLVPGAGGLEIEDGDRVITLLSPESPLYQQLLGKELGQALDQPPSRISSVL